MAFGFFESKKSKEEKQKAAENAKFEAEVNAKIAASTEKKKIEKMVAETEKAIAELTNQAAAAKAKGYEPVYRQCVNFIKVAKARRAQAEMFLAQINMMQQMKKLADNSKTLLGSMNNVMSSLGKLSMDPEVMRNIQKDFTSAQVALDAQNDKLDAFYDGMEMVMPEDTDLDVEQFSDADIDAEIDSLLANNALNNAGVSSGAGSSADKDTMAYLNSVLNG